METQNDTIFKITGEIKAKRKDSRAVKLDDGNWYSDYVGVNQNKGDLVAIEYSINEQFRNIKKIETLQSSPTTQVGTRPAQKSNASFIVSYVKDLVIADKVEMDKFGEVALKLTEIFKEVEKAERS